MSQFIPHSLAIAFILALVWVMQAQIARVCQRTPSLNSHRLIIAATFVCWIGFVVARLTFLQDLFVPSDALTHERRARAVTDHVQHGRYTAATRELRAGNPAYQFGVGMFYAATGAPQYVVNFVNGTLGFWAMLVLLELICRELSLRRVPWWLFCMTIWLPTAIFWTTTHLKEGIAIWGIAQLLDAGAQGFRGINRFRKFTFGAVAVGLMRPHIAIGWTTALGCGFFMKRGGYKRGLFCLLAAVVCWQILVQIRPEITENFETEGVVATMEGRYQKNMNIGGSAIVRERPPIPVVSGLAMILMRPYPFEISGLASAVAGLEIWTLTGFCCWGWFKFLRHRQLKFRLPLLMSYLAALVMLAFFFGYTFNLGLMVRQRLQVLPAVIFLAAYPNLPGPVARSGA